MPLYYYSGVAEARGIIEGANEFFNHLPTFDQHMTYENAMLSNVLPLVQSHALLLRWALLKIVYSLLSIYFMTTNLSLKAVYIILRMYLKSCCAAGDDVWWLW